MKNRLVLIFSTVLCAFTIFSASTFAQTYTQPGLPEGAKARLGKGFITRTCVFSGRDAFGDCEFHWYLDLRYSHRRST